MKNGSNHEELLRQMALARAALTQNARSAVDDARTLADWKYHFRTHPWLLCGGAAALGFLLVPKRKQRHAAPSENDDSETSTAVQASIAATLLTQAVSVVARQSLNYFLRRGFNWLDQRTTRPRDAGAEPIRSERP